MVIKIIAAVVLLTIAGIYTYLKKYILLPSGINKLIQEVKSSGPKDLIRGIEKTVKNGDITINYEVISPRETPKGHVILISGLSQTLIDFHEHFYQPFVDAGYTVIRMDNRGVGLSSWIPEWTKATAFLLEDMATDTIAVLDKERIDKVHLIGMSMGGMISQRIAINYKDRIKSLTSIMSTGHYYDPDFEALPKDFYRKIAGVVTIYGRKLDSVDKKMKLNLAINRLLHGKGYDMDDRQVLEKAHYEVTQRKGYNPKDERMHGMAILKSGSRLEELKQLQLPALIIHGTADPLVKFEHGKKCYDLIPGARKLFIDGMGHDLPKIYTPKMSEAILGMYQEIDN